MGSRFAICHHCVHWIRRKATLVCKWLASWQKPVATLLCFWANPLKQTYVSTHLCCPPTELYKCRLVAGSNPFSASYDMLERKSSTWYTELSTCHSKPSTWCEEHPQTGIKLSGFGLNLAELYLPSWPLGNARCLLKKGDPRLHEPNARWSNPVYRRMKSGNNMQISPYLCSHQKRYKNVPVSLVPYIICPCLKT